MPEPGQQNLSDAPINPSELGTTGGIERQGGDLSPEDQLRERYGEIKSRDENLKAFHKNYNEGVNKIIEATSIAEIQAELEAFLFYADKTDKVAHDRYESEYKQTIQQIRDFKEQGNLAGIQSIIENFSKKIHTHYATPESTMPDIPESLEDLAAFIMKSESEQWKTGGKKELLDSEGKVVKENFLAWVRKRMIEVHEFNPTATVSFFEQITVRSRWSQISLYEMVLTGSYFLEKRNENVIVPGKDRESPDESEKPAITYHKNEDYEALRQQLLTETFLFNQSRNNHVEYIQNQFIGNKLAETLDKIYTPNTFTRSNFLEFIMSMPSMKYKEGEHSEKGKEIKNKVDKNFELGQSARKLLLAYNYIYDYKMLSEIFKNNGVSVDELALFTKEYDNINPEGKIIGKKIGTGQKGSRDVKNENGVETNGREGWYENGKLKTDKSQVMEEYLKFINVFTAPGPQKSEEIITEVRERMVQSIMKAENLDYDEAKYAEAWAFSMTKWTGLAAKNDTAAVGHDAWTKVLNTQEYRIRQMSDKRNAMHGNIFNMLGIKRIGLNFFEGITDENGRTILEVLQGGEGGKVDLEKSLKELPTKVRFAENTMRGFAGNHIFNSFNLLEFLINYDGFNFQNMLTFDSLGRSVIDYEKANKIIGGIEKALRYAYSTWGGTDYSKIVRTWEMETITDESKKNQYKQGKGPKKEIAVAKDMPILMEMFGEEIVEFLKEQSNRVYGENMKNMTDEARTNRLEDMRNNARVWNYGGATSVDVSKINNEAVRNLLWKGVFEYLIKAEIESHRNVFSDQERFNMSKMEAIYSFLEQKRIFSKEEVNTLRKKTHTTLFGMLLQEGGGGALFGGLRGALKGLRATTGSLTKV
jgi:hypothetical protein